MKNSGGGIGKGPEGQGKGCTMNSTGYTCLTGCEVQMQRGGSKNLDTSALGHRGRCVCGGGGVLPRPLGATEASQAGREILQPEEGLPAMPPRRVHGRGAGPRVQLGGCGDSTRRREPEMTPEPVKRGGKQEMQGKPLNSRTRAWCPVGHRDLCLHPRGSRAAGAG